MKMIHVLIFRKEYGLEAITYSQTIIDDILCANIQQCVCLFIWESFTSANHAANRDENILIAFNSSN